VKSFALCLESFITFFSYALAELQAKSACQKSLRSLMIRDAVSVPASHWRSFKESFIYGQSSPAQGCCANFAVGAVPGPHDYCVSVDCSTFILGFAWAGTVVVATWPLLLRLQKLLFGRRGLAVLVMTLLLFLLFIIPIACWSTAWWIQRPGYSCHYQRRSDAAGSRLAEQHSAGGRQTLQRLAQPAGDGRQRADGESAPVYWHHHHLVCRSGGAYRRFMMHCTLMLLFSALLYWRGEQVALGSSLCHPPGGQTRRCGGAAGGQAVRAVALGVVVTALVQAVLGGIGLAISGVPYATCSPWSC
jgi:predicted PurR-regulated permease PerM